jgi:hypothetical protein
MSYEATMAQAEAQAAAYKIQAQQYQLEADNQRNQAQAAQANANIEAKKQEVIADNYARQERELRDRRRLIAGQQKAQTGAAGIQFTGSALDILSAGDEAYNQDKLTLLSNQRYENWASRTDQMNFINQRNNLNTASRNALKNRDYANESADYAIAQGKSQGLATILGTAVSVAGGIAGSVGGSSATSGTTSASGVGSSGSGFKFGGLSTNMGYGTTSTFNNGKYSFGRTGYTKWF